MLFSIPCMLPTAGARALMAMWRILGNAITADDCICFAQLWDSAWEEGSWDRTIRNFNPIDEITFRNAPDLLTMIIRKCAQPLYGAGSNPGAIAY
jgi:hypothetical protein